MHHETSFINFLNSQGYELVRNLVVDKSIPWERLKYHNEKVSSGRYLFSICDKGAIGFYGSDKSGEKFGVWQSWKEDKGSLSDSEIKKLNAWYKKKKIELEKEEKAKHEEVKDRLSVDLLMLDNAKTHKYATDKGIEPKEVYINGDLLVIPMYQKDGEIWSVQNIYPNGTKVFEQGGKYKGGYFPISGDTDTVFVCEGYSTGRSINEATGKAVYVSFTAGNLLTVSKIARDKHKDCDLVIAADNDAFTEIKGQKVNVGITSAEKIAREITCSVVYPDFGNDIDDKPTDFNDYVAKYGLDEARKVLLNEEIEDELAPIMDLSNSKSLVAVKNKHEKIDDNNWQLKLLWKNQDHGIYDDKFSLHNSILYFLYQPQWEGTFVFDDFQKVVRIVKPLPWDDASNFKWKSVFDNDLTQLRAHLSYIGIRINSNKEMRDVISVVAEKNKVHPVQDYFDDLEWDRISRLDNWIIDYCDAKDQDVQYIRSVSACILKASVKRIYNAGEQFHHMPVLEGVQAAGKSTLWRTLSTFHDHEYFTDHLSFSDIDNPHMAAHLVGNIFVEFQEMTGSTSKDRNKIKSWITMPTDKIMPKYSNDIVDLPRQFIPVGTTNDGAWLNDPTGGRRFWPIKVGKIDIEGITKVKEQLWAEAVHRITMGELHYIKDTDPVYKKAQQEQAHRYIGHAWEDTIAEWVIGRKDITMDMILEECLFIPKERWNHANRNDVSDVMRSLGYENKVSWDGKLRKSIRKWAKND